MDILQKSRLLVVVFSLALVVGCVRTVTLPDGTEVPKNEYRAYQQEQHAQAVAGKLQAMVQDCPAEMTEKEASECRWSNAMAMVIMPQVAANLTPSGYWEYRAANRQFWLGIAQLAVNNPLTMALSQKWLYGSGGPGARSTEINFGNRTAKGGGASGGDKGVVGGASASGDSTFEDIQITTGNKSPMQTGDGVMTSGKDSQYQTGDGAQGQFLTRPNIQPGAATEGGDINNDSTGVSGAETGDIGL